MPKQIIFYSWQSDIQVAGIEKDVTKEFIFKAASEALDKIKEEYSDLLDVQIDRDTRGVSGTPAIVDAIFGKIDESNIFLADLTFIGESYNKAKKLPNSNVLIELGYASCRLGWDRIICVMNTNYGKPEHLPFDVKHRRHPIQFDLSPADSEAKHKQVRKKLINTLSVALKQMYFDGLFNKYVNEAEMRAAKWILRCVDQNIRFLYSTVTNQFNISTPPQID